MKKLIIMLLFVIMFSCDAETVKYLGEELTKDKRYQVALSNICNSDYADKTWYCISKNEYNKLILLPKSCNIISITTTSGNTYTSIMNDNSLRHIESLCKN